MNHISPRRADEWDIVLPRHITFEGKEFLRTGPFRSMNTRDMACQYICSNFFDRRIKPGLYINVVIKADEDPTNVDVVAAKLEAAWIALAEIAEREHKRTPMLELDALVNGDE